MQRFLVHQASGKSRGIDDGKKGHQNDASKLTETIFTTSTDWPAQAAGCLVKAWEADGCSDPPASPADGCIAWDLDPVLSTDDMPDAYRECPVRPADRRACFIAVWSTAAATWLFTELFGMAFGLACPHCSSTLLAGSAQFWQPLTSTTWRFSIPGPWRRQGAASTPSSGSSSA